MYAHPWSPPFWWSEELRSRSPLVIPIDDDRLFFPYAKRTWSLIAFTFFQVSEPNDVAGRSTFALGMRQQKKLLLHQTLVCTLVPIRKLGGKGIE